MSILGKNFCLPDVGESFIQLETSSSTHAVNGPCIWGRNLWSVETGHPMATISRSSLVGQSVSRIVVQENLMKTNDRHSTIPVSRHLLPSSAERKETCTCQVYLQISRIPRGLGGVSSLGCYGFRRKGQRKWCKVKWGKPVCQILWVRDHNTCAALLRKPINSMTALLTAQ